LHSTTCSALGGGLSLYLFIESLVLRVYFFVLLPFFRAGLAFYTTLCCLFYYNLLFIFQFCRAVWFWMLLSGSEDDVCDLLPSLLQLWVIGYLLSVFTAFPVFVY
jgi:hypothetical protein